MLLIFSSFLLLATLPLFESVSATYLLFLSQLILLVDQFRRGQVSGVGGFVFMSFLFFGVRPIYIVTESDYDLFSQLFLINVDLKEVNWAMWWATFGLLAFCAGVALFRHLQGPGIRAIAVKKRRHHKRTDQVTQMATDRMVGLLLFYQVLTVPVMFALAGGGRALYGSSLGAYAYDVPVPLQSGHIFALVVILECYLRGRDPGKLFALAVSGLLFLYFTWLMREVSMFRGFYIAGVMIAGIAVLQRIQKNVSLVWLILPIVLLQPLFKTLGEKRHESNEDLTERGILERTFEEGSALGSYWHFYDSSGDMNIFDTFVAAKSAEPTKRPYLLSWLYVPVHFVPRAIWTSKPETGILQDVSFMQGAPYAPGIAGFFLLDGGFLWMLGCMAVLGYLLAWVDLRVFVMPRSYLRCCLIAILSVNAMFLTRFFLWQYFYQVLYAVIPCFALAYYFRRKGLKRRAPKKRQRQRIAPPIANSEARSQPSK